MRDRERDRDTETQRERERERGRERERERERERRKEGSRLHSKQTNGGLQAMVTCPRWSLTASGGVKATIMKRGPPTSSWRWTVYRTRCVCADISVFVCQSGLLYIILSVYLCVRVCFCFFLNLFLNLPINQYFE